MSRLCRRANFDFAEGAVLETSEDRAASQQPGGTERLLLGAAVSDR